MKVQLLVVTKVKLVGQIEAKGNGFYLGAV